MEAIFAGQATDKGFSGAGFWIRFFKELPHYYISKQEALAMGWVNWLWNLHKVAPGKMIGGDIYYNDNKHLPDAPGRIWHEADINYVSGRRNSERLLYSNDGLIFVTYEHYKTFYEII